MAVVTHGRPGKRNVRLLLRFLLLLAAIIAVFTITFHGLMAYEGQDHSWMTGFYWTMVTMSTLGFGDVTFNSDIGKAFSVLVLMTGVVFLLVLMPFTFIEFFYSPWMKAQQEARAPRKVSENLTGHVIIARDDPVTAAFITWLERYRCPYVLAAKTLPEALEKFDAEKNVVLADLNEPPGLEAAGIGRAAMLVATADDFTNTGIVFNAREPGGRALIVATANSPDSVDVLQLAGADHVIELADLLGSALARRTIAGDAQAHIIGNVGDIQIAEATAAGTPLVGKPLRESRLRELSGLNVVGIWQRGKFRPPSPADVITRETVFVLAGSADQLAAYNELFCIYHRSGGRGIVIGAGRVGRAAAAALSRMEIERCVVDKDPARGVRFGSDFVCGSAADFATLESAGIADAPAVLVTTHDDAVNIYLTIYCRKLRPDIQIIARATSEESTARLHRAGADFVMSYATMGAGILFNLLRKRGDIVMIAEGLNVFRVPLPADLENVPLADSGIRSRTGCNVIAVERGGSAMLNPDPALPLLAGDELVLIGTVESEETFLKSFLSRKA